MTDYQNELVMEHLDLVNWVIRTRISVPNRPLLTYDDFYAIGCEAICRAALKYQVDSGEFAPFACRYIYNAIIDHCRAMNYRLQRSVDAGFEEGEVLFDLLALTTVDFESEVTDDSATPGQSGSGNDEDDNGLQQGKQAVEEDLSSQLPKAAPNFTMKTTPVPNNGSFTPDPGQMNAIRAQAERVISEESDRIAAHLTNSITSSGIGGVDQNSEYDGYDYEHAAEDIERLLEHMAEEKVTEELEEELSEELQREANSIRYGNAHRNIHITVNRMARVDQDLIDSYNRVAPELLMLSKRLQRSVSPALRDRRQGGKQTGLLIGKRLNQHALHRTDGRIFYNSRLPTEPISLSVGLLIDESGSMCSNDRITRARATAIVIQDFCESLGIPLLVVGHTAWSSHVELFSYSDFDTYDKNNRYRLMDMSARDCNRDGAALRFVAEKLSKQTSEVKILMIICDGQPNDDGYSGSAAEADLRGIKLEYARKGVKIYAAAIGEDRPRIERIYGDGYLDITNLQELPVMLTNLIVRSLPH